MKKESTTYTYIYIYMYVRSHPFDYHNPAGIHFEYFSEFRIKLKTDTRFGNKLQ